MRKRKRVADPAIDEVREARHMISARFDHDPERLVRHYLELQERYRDRLLSDGRKRDPKGRSAA